MTLLASLLYLVACGGPAPESAAPPPGGPEPLRFELDDALQGVKIELSEGKPAPVVPGDGGAAEPPAQATPLDDAAAQALVARLPALELEDGDRTAFAKREDSLPPPQTGARVDVPFPPPEQPDAPEVATGPLHVVRFAPQGDVGIAPHLSITFDQPMVAITSQEEAAKVRPVKVTPEPPGTWRWLGTKTLLFEPDPRFPMATEYTVEIPAGTKSATGGALEEAQTFTFRTPPPSVVTFTPQTGPMDLDPLVYLAFDQQVDEAQVLAHTRLRGESDPIALRRATAEELAVETWARDGLAKSPPGRAFAFFPTRPLKPATSYEIVVEEGMPSAEGPLVTKTRQAASFWTYPPLGLSYTYCDQGSNDCTPQGDFYLYFNNPLDVAAFQAGWVTVEPPLEHLRVQPGGNVLHISGDTRAETKYTVTVGAPLRDKFGQTLGKPLTADFRVGHAAEVLLGPPREFLVLDPAAPPAFSVFSMNLQGFRARVYDVGPDSYAAVSKWMRDARYDGYRKGEPPAKRLAALDVKVADYVADETVETPLDLAPYLGPDGFGHVLLWLEPPTQPKDPWAQTHHFVWVQRTALGLVAVLDQDDLITWASSLGDASPLAGVEVGLLGQAPTAKTDAQGLAKLAKYPSSAGPHAIVARRGDDVALLPQNQGWWNEWGSWTTSTPSDSVAWLVYDDRRMYRPGETVSVKGWMRRYDNGPGGGIEGMAGLPKQLAYTLYDSMGNKLAEGTTPASATGGFDLAIELPKTPNLGWARLDLAGGGEVWGHTVHTFQIQEFRRPEFEVSAAIDPRPYVLGEHALATVHAGYYAGGALPDAPVTWQVTASEASFVPPGQSDFQFGPWSPWWGRWGWDGGSNRSPAPQRFEGRTDGAGEHTLRMDFLGVNPPRPYSVRAEATVVDVNRQRWTSGDQLLLHPASEYVGLATEKGFYEQGEEVEVDVIVADLEGARVAGREVTLTWNRLQWKQGDQGWAQVEEKVDDCDVASAADAETCGFRADEGGSYRIHARLTDPEGRPNQTTIEVWVAGGIVAQAPVRNVTMEQLTLVPDGKEWQPGDTAKILVQSPFYPAEGLLVVGRNGIMETRRFAMATSTTTLEVPITEASVPNVELRVDVVGTAERKDDAGQVLADKARRVAFASGQLSLSVPPLKRTLKVTATPREAAVDPGGSTVIDITVTDADGKPAAGEVALVVVDESVLALSSYTTPDPIAVFYQNQGGGFELAHLREIVVLADPDAAGAAGSEGDLGALRGEAVGGLGYIGAGEGGGGAAPMPAAAPAADAPMMKDEAVSKSAERSRASAGVSMAPPPPPPPPGASGPAIELREDFDALALFSPHVAVDATGKAQVPLKLPDSLTRYRIMAVAVSGDDRFGAGESTITARKPVMIRPSPPRFLNFGDRAELPLVVQNQTDEPITVDVALRVANASILTDVAKRPEGEPDLVAGLRVTIPAEDRRELRIPIAADLAGTARFQAVVSTGAHTDAAEFSFPVWTPATSEAFATYGEVDDGVVVQPVAAPPDVWPQFGGLEIQTSSTAVQALTDAVLWLVSYPYDCSEQIASRVLAVAGLRDVLTAFEADQLPSPAALEDSVGRDLERLRKRQHGNGGWSFWPELPDEPYLTVHVTHALVRAKGKGFAVDAGSLERAQHYLKHVEQHIPALYPPEARWAIRAYALNVRHQLGDDDAGKARELLKEAGSKLPLEAQGWLLPVLHATKQAEAVDQLVRSWENNASETAATAQFNVGYDDQTDYVLLHSDRRADAVLLEALIEVRPAHDLIPKVVRGLLGHRTAGHWSSTQENSFVLLSLDRYFRVFEAKTPDFVARAWLGDQYAGEHAFRGRTTEKADIRVPMALLTDPGGTQDLILQKDGVGRMYYRIGMKYAPKDLTLEPADYGFAVQRAYEGVDDPADVKRDADGTWRVRSGARVRVRLTMVAEARRYHVALVDPLPGGFEPMNPELATTGTVPADPSQARPYWWWYGPWYEHQNMRDERVEAFTRILWDGVHTYTYVATATTPGHFVVPPAKAEEMYHPETFGRSGTERVVIE